MLSRQTKAVNVMILSRASKLYHEFKLHAYQYKPKFLLVLHYEFNFQVCQCISIYPQKFPPLTNTTTWTNKPEMTLLSCEKALSGGNNMEYAIIMTLFWVGSQAFDSLYGSHDQNPLSHWATIIRPRFLSLQLITAGILYISGHTGHPTTFCKRMSESETQKGKTGKGKH